VVKIKKKIKKVIKIITYWAFLAFIIYLIFELTRKILGGSLGFEELIIGLLIANLGYSFYIKGSMSRLETKLSGHLGWHRGREGL